MTDLPAIIDANRASLIALADRVNLPLYDVIFRFIGLLRDDADATVVDLAYTYVADLAARLAARG